ncbi:MAG TPA: hypothetical protein VLA90_00740 [Actinomycetota bacterium]|nr:hypothetical protein [Actinomycetota bacterium]
MDKRRLVWAGIVAASMVAGGVLGAVAFTPRVGVAADSTEEAATGSPSDVEDRPFEECFGVAGPLRLGIRPPEVAAETIGIDAAELFAALRDGETIAEVAGRHGVDPDDVVDAVVAAFREHLDRAVEEGWLTEEEADERATELRERAEAFVNGEVGPFALPGRFPDVGARFGHGMSGPRGGSWSESWSEEPDDRSL